jgi:DNA-binding MarR family transcriptional regulator
MAFTKEHARILIGMVPPEQRAALSFICGKDNMAKAHATPEVIDDLIALGLVRRDRTVEAKPRDVVVLTPKGKKCAEFV